jgi:hypothetical protein
MTDEDIQQIIATLIRKLKTIGLDWVVAEYFTTIRAGKIETKDAKYEYWSEERNDFRAAAKAKKVTVTVPFTPREQALLLIDAIENSTVVPHDLAEAIDVKLRELLPDKQFSLIEFKPDLESVVVTPGLDESLPDIMKGFVVVFRDEASKSAEVNRLRNSCKELRDAISK